MSLIRHCVAVALILPSLAAVAPARAAGPESYGLDPVHTRVMFALSHAGFSQAIGTVSGSRGRLWFDRDDWRSARLEVEVPLTRLDLGDAKWNRAALAANLLDGKRHPLARFVSERVEPDPADPDRAQVCGRLSLRGATRPLCLDVRLNALKRHPLPPFRRTAGFSATARLSRADYGIDAWKSAIGDEVELRIEAEAVRGAYLEPSAADAVERPPEGPPSDPPADPVPSPDPSAATAEPEPRR
ncbi:YceI family protein [Lysobacter antibioticus]|uniref:YceI family protein n=1 Tax=Lysobacter antibioticus TaxID=84531 RepID=UPI000348D0CB|nr:YceI family protein [Lysobacter antibioticus]